MSYVKQERTQQELTITEIEALEAIELPAREALTGGISVSAAVCIQANVNVNLGGLLGCLNPCE